MTRLRSALIGCGKVGATHATALCHLNESELVGVCDVSAARATAFAERFGTVGFDHVSEMLDVAKPEAVLIATPHPIHREPAVLALSRGIHVLVEKPLASNLADSDAMLDAATSGGATLGVISQRRYFEPVRRMKEAIDAGKIGRPVLGLFLMYSWRDEAYYRSDPWRGRWDTEGGGVLVNQSPHQLDMLQWLMGEVEEVSGTWTNLNHPTIEVDDTAIATVRFRGGGIASIVTSLSQKPGIYTKVHIHGDTGASIGVQTDTGATFVAGVSGIVEPPFNDIWTIPGEEHRLDEFRARDRAAFEQVNPTDHYHMLNIRDFLRAVCGECPVPVSGKEGRVVVSMFEAIYRSHREKRTVTMPLS